MHRHDDSWALPPFKKRFHEAQKMDMSSSVQCLAAEIAGLIQGNLARLKTPQASQNHRILLPYPSPTHQCSTTSVGHGFKREDGMCSGLWWIWIHLILWIWIFLILKRTTPWHSVWCQLKKKRKDSAGSDDTASMIKGGGYIGARTRQPPPKKKKKKFVLRFTSFS